MPTLMKGNKWRDRKHTMTYPAWCEIKVDEIRCHVVIEPVQDTHLVKFLSYAGKPLANMHKFSRQFIELHKATGFTEFDCGFEANGNFTDSSRWIKSTKGLPEDLQDVKTKFYLFDLPELADGQAVRMAHRNMTVANALEIGLAMEEPQGKWAYAESDVLDLFVLARRAGQEGLMVKSVEGLYNKGKRTDAWLKVKPEDDADGIITGLTEAVASRDFPELNIKQGDGLKRIGSITVAVEDGSVASPSGIEHELGADMFNNPTKYIGQWCEFKFMQRDSAGGYRHPVFHRIREAKV